METLLAVLMIGGVIYLICVSNENARLKGELNYKTMKEKTLEYKRKLSRMHKDEVEMELIIITESDKFKSLWNRAIEKFNDNHDEERIVPQKEWAEKWKQLSPLFKVISDCDEDAIESIHQYMAMIDMEYTCKYLALLELL